MKSERSSQGLPETFLVPEERPGAVAINVPSIICRKSEYRRVPWKNGKGVAMEVFSMGSSADEIPDWRVSLAVISTAASFSAFPNMDRTMCVLSEGGIHLEVGQKNSVMLYKESKPFHFAGEAEVRGEPLSTEALNINFMAHRSRVRHTITRMSKPEPFNLPYGRLGSFLFCIKGDLSLTANLRSIDLADFDAIYFRRQETLSWCVSPTSGSEWLLATLDAV